MPTNFENIEINDAAGTPRKVAGDFEVQGPDTIFHQTARNLNTILEEATGVTLSSATPTDIALNGMESHVILDIAGVMDHQVQIQLQYTTGGPFYAADWDKLQPLETLSGQRENYWYPIDSEGWKPTDEEGFDVVGGTHVFAIPTNGARTCRLQLYGSSVTITGTAWKRVVLASSPVVHAITKAKRMFNQGDHSHATPDASYTTGDWLGTTSALGTDVTTPGTPEGIVTIKQLAIGPNIFGTPTVFGDIDVIITTDDMAVTDGAAAAMLYSVRVLAVLQFRAVPGPGQYPLTAFTSGGNLAVANELSIVCPTRTISPNNTTFAYMSIIAVDAIASPGASGMYVSYVLDWG